MIETAPARKPDGFEEAMMPKRNVEEPPPGGVPWWEDMSANSDREDVREEIGRLIRQGLITVRPRSASLDKLASNRSHTFNLLRDGMPTKPSFRT